MLKALNKLIITNCILLVFTVIPSELHSEKTSHKSNWNAIIKDANIWEATTKSIGKIFAKHRLQWLDSKKNSLVSKTNYKLFDIPITETRLYLNKDKLSKAYISIYNRGDNGLITKDEFTDKINASKNMLDKALSINGEIYKNKNSAVSTKGWIWKQNNIFYLLEYSERKPQRTKSIDYRPEFIRLQIAPKNNSTKKNVAIARSTLTENLVKKDNGDIFVDKIPMVDQGQKGYCVVAVVERLFRYYGMEVDQHEFAQIGNTSNSGGTTTADMNKALKKIRGKFKIGLKEIESLDYTDFSKIVKKHDRIARREKKKLIGNPRDINSYETIYARLNPDIWRKAKTQSSGYSKFKHNIKYYINKGYPIMWTVTLGLYPEGKSISQTTGGHMRLIIGYNFEDKDNEKIIFSDTWGSGHEKKYLSSKDAYSMTKEIFLITPTR